MTKKKADEKDKYPEFEMPDFSAADKVRGDLRDAMLGWLRSIPKPFADLSESEQRSIASAADMVACEAVRATVHCIAADERPVIVAMLEQVTIKDNYKATLTLPRSSEHAADLINAVKKDVLIVVTDADSFMGEHGPAKIDKDQKELPTTTAKAIAADKGAQDPHGPPQPESPAAGLPLARPPYPFPATGDFDVPVYIGYRFVGTFPVQAENLGGILKLGYYKAGADLRKPNPNNIEEVLDADVLADVGAVLPEGTPMEFLTRIPRLTLKDAPPKPSSPAEPEPGTDEEDESLAALGQE